jgi:cytochrome c peroxidase
MKYLFPIAGSALILLGACHKTPPTVETTDSMPSLPASTYDYPASSNDALATLGRVLFYDKQLSTNNDVACGSCHRQDHAFCDNQQFSDGTAGKTARNTPSIFNRGGRLFWDGRASSMFDLVTRPVKNPVEMNSSNLKTLAEGLSHLDYYQPLIKAAYPGKMMLDSNNLKEALTEFVKNISFANNRYKASKNGTEALSQQEQEGHSLFFGKALCFNCHKIDNASPGVSEYYGAADHHNIGLDLEYADRGVGAISRQERDNGSFMMPILMNVEYTAPYMHDGRFKTLEEVVEHYNSKIVDHPNLSSILRQNGSPNGPPVRLNLSDIEKQSLVAFLKTLSDPAIFTDYKLKDPFVSRN